jgi:hypothetical protein
VHSFVASNREVLPATMVPIDTHITKALASFWRLLGISKFLSATYALPSCRKKTHQQEQKAEQSVIQTMSLVLQGPAHLWIMMCVASPFPMGLPDGMLWRDPYAISMVIPRRCIPP